MGRISERIILSIGILILCAAIGVMRLQFPRGLDEALTLLEPSAKLVTEND